MALLDYPIPNLDVTLQEASRVLQLILSPEEYVDFKKALSEQMNALTEAHKQMTANTFCCENWVTHQFKQRLLSTSDPLPVSTAIPSVLTPSKFKGEGAQLERAAALLWAAAKLYSEPLLVEGNMLTERTQQSEIFATSRLPGKDQDQIKVYPESLHAIVTCRAGIFPIQIIQKSGAEGTICPVPLHDLYTQLASIMCLPAAASPQNCSIVCRLSALDRHAWHAVREEIQKAGGEAAKSLEVMESSILALALEDCAAPADLAHTLNVVSLGCGNDQYLRYYDKVMNMVVFRDGVAGMLFEHSTVDGMVAGLVVGCLWTLSESQDLEQTPADRSRPTVLPLKPLQFPLGGINIPALSLETYVQRSSHIETFEFPCYPDVFATLRGHRSLYDAWINFALQLSLKQTLGESASHFIMVTPTQMRHYKYGRCDPTFSITAQSLELVSALDSCSGPDNEPCYTKELLVLFHRAFSEHKSLIKATKSGNGVGPHIGVLRNWLPQDNVLKRFLNHFGCPSIYLTGSDMIEGVEGAVGNVYARDQLAVAYLGKKDKVRLLLNAKGTFANVLDNLVKRLEKNLKLVMMVAIRYAIVGQMGGIECLLETNEDFPTQNIHVKESDENNEQSPEPAPAENQDFTLVIHGGAGEEMMLSNNVLEVIEFALLTALTLGSRVLTCGGSSLDAVQRSVSALEDCFMFNAGKGSVYNRNGQHELEASIMDGHSKKSGAVACLRRVKNPVNAARKVMDKSEHSLLTGEGAEEFLESLEEKEKTVNADYFHTDQRYRELTMKLIGSENNHPQTVGAVAVDCRRRLAAASSTGGLVGKRKGRIGDTAVIGAGTYADDKLAVTCSGDGDAFLCHTVAHKVASLYNLKGYSLRQACREVLYEDLGAKCAGIIAIDHKGKAVVETNSGVMLVGSMIDGVPRAEANRPMRTFANVIWETDELVAYLHPEPWTPGTTILTRKAWSGPSSIFDLNKPDYEAMLLGAQTIANLLCEKLGVHRCALLSMPQPDKPAHIKILPLRGLEPSWRRCLAKDKEFHEHHPGYCTSKDGSRCEDSILDQVQAKIRNHLPTPDASPCHDFHGDESHDDLFARIVRGTEKHWRVWEDDEHVAFLTPVPNTPGMTVLVPRKSLSSDIFRLDKTDYKALLMATRKVARLLKKAMDARGVALIFEGMQINYAHAKLIPLITKSGEMPAEVPPEFCPEYPGYVTSVDGPPASADDLEKICTEITQTIPPGTWCDPNNHSISAINSQWYRNLFQIQNTLFHSTVEYFKYKCNYAYALTPITTDTISSPMGLGSDSVPVSVELLGQNTYLADSMQFLLEYFLRFQEGLPGVYYICTSFRGEEHDFTHLNQFYHVECELLGDMDAAISIAEGYVSHLTRALLKEHSGIILNAAGTLSHAQDLIKRLEGPLPRVSLEEAILMMPSADCYQWVQEAQPQHGRKLTRKGEEELIKKYGGAVWLKEMDHLSVPFYQAYVEGSDRKKAKAADLLLGLGETLGLGERHSTPEMVQKALCHHEVKEDNYKWYMDMRKESPLRTSGWGMGTERYLCWLLQQKDVRDMQIIPRLKGIKHMP